MNIHSHKLILKAVLGGLFVVSAVPADAGCHSRSSGHSYGSSHSSHSVYSRPMSSVPVHQHHHHVYQAEYSQPVYSQPTYSQPQPVYSQPTYPQSQPVYSQPTYPQSQPVYSQPTYPQSQPLPSQAQPQYGTGPQTVPVSAQQSYPVNGQPQPMGTPPVGSMPANSQGFPNTTIPVSASGPNAAQNPLIQSAPVAAPGTPAVLDAQQSALQALGGFGPPATAATQSTPVPQMPLAGMWTANLPNGSRVQLALQADGSFSWTAVNKDGQSSVFQGTYTMQNGSLSLTRGNDGQKLDGSMTLTGPNTFSFQLSAAQSASLDFVRG